MKVEIGLKCLCEWHIRFGATFMSTQTCLLDNIFSSDSNQKQFNLGNRCCVTFQEQWKRISTLFSAHEISSSKTTLKPRDQTDDHQSIRAKRTTNEKNAPIRWFVCLSFFIVHQPLFVVLITQFDTAVAFLKSKERSQRVAIISWRRWKALGSCLRLEARRGWATLLGCFGQSESMDLVNLALQTSSYIYIQSPVALR